MKKEKFTLTVNGYDYTLVKDLTISKEEFNKRLKELKEQVELTQNDEYPVSYYESEFQDFETVIIKVYTFTVATTDVYLKYYKCKDGYCFIK